jgi:1-acyl-sn-glycerol-3-phosphate acyltransferase/long-chain acyl-CoA synthetase
MKQPEGFWTPVFSPVTRPLFELFARSVFRLWCPLRIEGREHLPPLPFIICGNHNSHMDSVALLAASGYRFDRFAMLAATDYFYRNALVFRWFAGMVRLLPLPRSASPAALRRTVSLCRGFIEDGSHGLILFPEGTRSRTGVMGPFRRGASFLAARLGVPVVPAHIEGTGGALPVGGFLPRPRQVCVRFAPPVFPGDARSPSGRDRLLSEMRDRICSLEARANGS